MLTNRFVKSCKSERLPYRANWPLRMTQFFARGDPFDIRTAELEFRLHTAKACATSETLEALQHVRTEVNQLFRFFQQIFFIESDVCTIALKAIDRRSDFVLIVDTNKFVSSPSLPTNPGNIHSYFFWSMVLGPLLYFTSTQPSRGSEADSVRSAVRDLTAAWRSNASRSE
jgi:hypothetical protein